MVPFDRPHIFLLTFHCNYVSLACTTVVFMCANKHTKFEVPSFANSKDMVGQNLKMAHVTLTMIIRDSLSSHLI